MLSLINQFREQLWPVIRRTAQEWREDDGAMLASSIAYYAAFSFLPLMFFALVILGYTLQFSSQAQEEKARIFELIEQHTSEELRHQISNVMDEVQDGAQVNGPISLLILMYGAANIFLRLQTAMDRIWKNDRVILRRGFLAAVADILLHRLRAFVGLLLACVLLIIAFVGSTIISAIQPYLVEVTPVPIPWTLVQLVLGMVFHTLVFTLIYKGVSRSDVFWREAAAGGVLAGLTWEVARQLLAAVIVTGRFSAYGVVGSFIAIMLWFYIAAAILLLGAEFVQVVSTMRNEEAVEF